MNILGPSVTCSKRSLAIKALEKSDKFGNNRNIITHISSGNGEACPALSNLFQFIGKF